MNPVRPAVTASNCKQLRKGSFSLNRRKMCSYFQNNKEGMCMFSGIQQGLGRTEQNNRKM